MVAGRAALAVAEVVASEAVEQDLRREREGGRGRAGREEGESRAGKWTRERRARAREETRTKGERRERQGWGGVGNASRRRSTCSPKRRARARRRNPCQKSAVYQRARFACPPRVVVRPAERVSRCPGPAARGTGHPGPAQFSLGSQPPPRAGAGRAGACVAPGTQPTASRGPSRPGMLGPRAFSLIIAHCTCDRRNEPAGRRRTAASKDCGGQDGSRRRPPTVDVPPRTAALARPPAASPPALPCAGERGARPRRAGHPCRPGRRCRHRRGRAHRRPGSQTARPCPASCARAAVCGAAHTIPATPSCGGPRRPAPRRVSSKDCGLRAGCATLHSLHAAAAAVVPSPRSGAQGQRTGAESSKPARAACMTWIARMTRMPARLGRGDGCRARPARCIGPDRTRRAPPSTHHAFTGPGPRPPAGKGRPRTAPAAVLGDRLVPGPADRLRRLRLRPRRRRRRTRRLRRERPRRRRWR